MKKPGVVRRDTSLELVLEYIRNAILDGTYPPGTQLKQSVIASDLGVSQGPTREALIQLVSEGLVENVPFHGMFVRQLTYKDVEEIYQLRQALESLAMRIALPILNTPEHLAVLEQLVQDTIRAEELGDYEKAVANDLAFHRYMVKASGNERLINFWSSLLAQATVILRRLYQVERELFHESMAQNHQVILEAIKTQDDEEVEHILREHMDYACSRLVRLIQSQDKIQSGELVVERVNYA
jgi:DNA-binding GntR family transcriptional regulator